MFTAAKLAIEEARKLVKTAKALKGFSKSAMREYIKKAETKLTMAELYIK